MVSSLLSIIYDDDWSIQTAAIRALGEIGDPDAVLPLTEAVLGDDEWVAETAAEALGIIGDVRAIPALLDALASDQLLRRCDALLEQKNGRTDSGTLVLLGQTYFDISDLRCTAARALGRIGNEHVVPNLIAALNDPQDTYVQQAAAHALEQIATIEAIHAVTLWRQQRPVEEDRSQNQ